MNKLFIMVRIILCLVVIVIVFSVLLRVSELVLFMNIVVGGVLYYKNFSLLLINVV